MAVSFKVGDFVSETLVTDTRVYEIIGTTDKTVTVRTVKDGKIVRRENRDGNPYPLVFTGVVSDPDGKSFVLRRRNDGSFRRGRSGNPLRPATVIDGRPVRFTDYRF